MLRSSRLTQLRVNGSQVSWRLGVGKKVSGWVTCNLLCRSLFLIVIRKGKRKRDVVGSVRFELFLKQKNGLK